MTAPMQPTNSNVTVVYGTGPNVPYRTASEVPPPTPPTPPPAKPGAPSAGSGYASAPPRMQAGAPPTPTAHRGLSRFGRTPPTAQRETSSDTTGKVTTVKFGDHTSHSAKIGQVNAAWRAASKDGRPVVLVFGGDWCHNCHDLRDQLEREGYNVVYVENSGFEMDIEWEKQFGGDANPHASIPLTLVVPAGTQLRASSAIIEIGRSKERDATVHFFVPGKNGDALAQTQKIVGAGDASHQKIQAAYEGLGGTVHAAAQPAGTAPTADNAPTAYSNAAVQIGNNAVGVDNAADLDFAMKGKNNALVISIPATEYSAEAVQTIAAHYRKQGVTVPIVVVSSNSDTNAAMDRLFGPISHEEGHWITNTVDTKNTVTKTPYRITHRTRN